MLLQRTAPAYRKSFKKILGRRRSYEFLNQNACVQRLAIGRQDGVRHGVGREQGAQPRLQPQGRRVPGAAVLHGLADGPRQGCRIARGDEGARVGAENLRDAADLWWRSSAARRRGLEHNIGQRFRA